MARRKISTTVYLREEQLDQLRTLQIETGVPVAELIRRGLDSMLRKPSAIVTPGADRPAIDARREELVLRAQAQLEEATRLLKTVDHWSTRQRDGDSTHPPTAVKDPIEPTGDGLT